MKSLPFILLALAALMLANCNGTTVAAVGSAAGMYLTKPKEPPPADTADQIAQHDSWCYETMGYAECYSQAQNTEPDRLINVDPQNKYPLTNHDYWEVVYQGK
jgi:hypothetical protein